MRAMASSFTRFLDHTQRCTTVGRRRRRSTAACLLRSWVQIPPGAWMSVSCECCVLSGRGLCNELITRPEESLELGCLRCVLCSQGLGGCQVTWQCPTCNIKTVLFTLQDCVKRYKIVFNLYCWSQGPHNTINDGNPVTIETWAWNSNNPGSITTTEIKCGSITH